jgi:putative phosphoribosyl transferase
VSLSHRIAVVVDDGIATGATASAACRVARGRGARRVVLAAPVAARDSLDRLLHDADEIVCAVLPQELWSIGAWYEEFPQLSDDEVVAILDRAARERRSALRRRRGDRQPEGISAIAGDVMSGVPPGDRPDVRP